MIRSLMIAASSALALSGCQTTPAEPTNANVSDARDCAVMTAILKQHHKIEAGTRYHIVRGNPNAPEEFRVTCDFKAAGIPIEDYDFNRKSTVQDFQGRIDFDKPTYPTANTAKVAFGSLIGPLAGSGQECDLRRQGSDWVIDGKCRMTWIS
jgi:hypothetical protein